MHQGLCGRWETGVSVHHVPTHIYMHAAAAGGATAAKHRWPTGSPLDKVRCHPPPTVYHQPKTAKTSPHPPPRPPSLTFWEAACRASTSSRSSSCVGTSRSPWSRSSAPAASRDSTDSPPSCWDWEEGGAERRGRAGAGQGVQRGRQAADQTHSTLATVECPSKCRYLHGQPTLQPGHFPTA